MTMSRTTVVLSATDRATLTDLASLMATTSDTDALRRAIRLAHRLVQFDANGGEVILRDQERETRVVFL